MADPLIGWVLSALALLVVGGGVLLLLLYIVYELVWHEVETEPSSIRDRAKVALPIGGREYVARDPSSGLVETGETKEQAVDELITAVKRRYD